MLNLDSPRWRDLRHAYGPAGDVPDLLRAIAAETEPRYSDHPAQARENPTPWDEVFTKLIHQYGLYSATYAAFPHIVAIAETSGLAKQQETLILAGTIRVQGEAVGEIPHDLLEDFELAMVKARRWSLRIVRQAALANRFVLPSLLQAFGGLRHPKSVYVRVLDHFHDGDWELEIDECPECGEYVLARMENSGPVTMPVDSRGIPIEKRAKRAVANRAEYRKPFELGAAILQDSDDPSWVEADTGKVLAALALERGNPVLADRILDIDATVSCPHCDESFRLAQQLQY